MSHLNTVQTCREHGRAAYARPFVVSFPGVLMFLCGWVVCGVIFGNISIPEEKKNTNANWSFGIFFSLGMWVLYQK
jgi:hypothetical protein